jgi:outer membrane protein W
VTGSQLKYINAFPMLVNATYYFKPSEQSVVPFVSFGTGTYFITQKYQLGVWEIENDNWHFGIATEAGILFRIENKVGFNTSARLNYAFDSGVSITGSDDNDLSYWTINAGFTVLY